ncbi:MAG: Ig-like domain-containing protein, partial [Gemmatimonadales bacterium]
MRHLRHGVMAAVLAALWTVPTAAQDVTRVAGLRAVPERPSVALNESVPFRVEAVDAQGNVVDGVDIRVVGRGVRYADGSLTGLEGGTQVLFASLVVPADYQGAPAQLRIDVEVTWPAVARIDIAPLSDHTLYAGTGIRHRASAFHRDGSQRPGATFAWSSSDPSVASVDAYGSVTAHRAGTVTVHADFDGARGSLDYQVAPF